MASGNSGANAYWPGFVDALTNVVIAMIFVVVVLAISLSFAAQMMGRKVAEKIIQEYEAKRAGAAPVASVVPAKPEATRPTVLKETTRIAVQAPAASAALRRPTEVLDQPNFLLLDYAATAVSLDAAAQEKFKAAVERAGASRKGRVQLLARGPDLVLSDNQRTAFMRLMALRNALLSLGVAADRIQMRVETESTSATDVVQVSFQD